jgi:tetratricopeptide (TPR) repeat protein
MNQFLPRHVWIALVIGLGLLFILPNSFFRSMLPSSGSSPIPTTDPTSVSLEAAYQQGLQLVIDDADAALPLLQQVAFSANVHAESARTLVQAIESGRLEDDPAYMSTRVGQALAAMNEWKLAQQAFLQAVEQNPEYAEAWAFLGEAQQQNGEDGYPALDRAMELDPNSLSALLFTSLYWQRQEDYVRAAMLIHKAALLQPEDASIQIQWGQNSLLAGDIVEAQEHFESAAALSPDDNAIWAQVARYSVESELFVDDLGLPASLRFLKNEPDDPEALVLVGRAFFVLGNLVTADSYLSQAVENFPNYMPSHYYYALYLLANNEASLAIVHLNKVIELAPASPEAKLSAELIVRNSQ